MEGCVTLLYKLKFVLFLYPILDSIVVSIPACHAGGRGSIPRRGDFFVSYYFNILYFSGVRTYRPGIDFTSTILLSFC
jgi:hypothetical protein